MSILYLFNSYPAKARNKQFVQANLDTTAHKVRQPLMRKFLKQSFLKIFRKSHLVQNDMYYPIPQKSIDGIFSFLMDGCVYDRDWEAVEGFEENQRKFIDSLSKISGNPENRAMHIN